MREFSLIFFLIQFASLSRALDVSNQNVGLLAVQDLLFAGFNDTYHLPDHALFNSHPKRFRRNADDPLNTVIQRMKTLSSVTNAVALQIGLLADTIPHYDVIAELLHFDHVKSSDLKNPIANDVETILNSFATLPDQFEEDVTDVLTAFDILLGIKDQISKVQDVKNWKLEQTLQSDLESLEKDGFDLRSYDAVKNPVSVIVGQLGTLVSLANKEDQSKVVFGFISDNANDLLTKPVEFAKTIDNIVKLKSGSKAIDSFSDILTLTKTMKTCKDNEKNLKIKPESDKKLTKNIALVSTVTERSLQLSSYLETIKSVIEAQQTSSSYRALAYTAGLPNGFEDLKSVPFHKSDTWLESITDTTSLFKALTVLDLFIEKVKEVAQQLSYYRNQKPSPIDTVNGFVKGLDSSSLLHKDADSVLKEMFRCLSIIPVSPPLVDLEKLSKEIAQIDTAVESIKKSMGESIGLLTNNEFVSMIKDIKGISAKAATLTEKPELKALIDQLLNYKRKAELEQKFTNFTTQFNNVKTEVSNLKTLATNLKKKLVGDTMKNFQAAWNFFKDFLDGLRKIDVTKVDVVKKLIARSKELQSSMPDTVKKEVIKVVNAVTKLQTMTDLSAVISNMKSQETDETKQFSDLVDSGKLSEVIGTATRGIVNFKDLSVKKSQFDLVQSHLPLVESEISSHQGLTQPEIETPIELKKFQKIFEDLEKWSSGVKLPDPDTIPNYADIIVGGLDLTSEDINEPIKLSETVGKLQGMAKDPTVKQNLLELKTMLDELNSIGVKLSVYNDAVSKTRDALNSLNTYFANHKKEVPTIPTTAVSLVQKSTPLSILTSTGFAEVTIIGWISNNISLSILIALLSILFVAIIVGLLVACCCYGWRPCQKKKNGMKEHEKIPLINPPAPPPKTETLPLKTKVTTVNETAKEVPKKEEGEKDKKDDEEKKVNNEELNGEKKDVELPVVNEEKPRVPIEQDQCNIPPETFENLVREHERILLAYQFKKGRSSDTLEKETLIYFCSAGINTLIALEVKRNVHKKHENQIRKNPVFFNPAALLWFHSEFIKKVYNEDNFINGAAYTFDNRSTWFLCETPIVPHEKKPNRTDDKFALLVPQVNAEAVVFICDESELKSESEPTYGEYFPREEKQAIEIALKPNGQKLVMTCISKDSLLDGQLIVRKMKIKFKESKPPPKEQVKEPRFTQKEIDLLARMNPEKTEEMNQKQIDLRNDLRDGQEQLLADKEENRRMWDHEHLNFAMNPNDIDVEFTHYQLMGWKAGSVPENTVPVKELLNLLKGKSNVILHCSNGIERCGTLTYIEALRQECSRQWKLEEQSVQIDYDGIAEKVQIARPGALNLYIHAAFSMMTLVDIAKSTYKLKDKASDLRATKIYGKLHELYQYALDHRGAVDPVKDEIKPMVEQKKIGDAPKETKKPAETVDVPKLAKKSDETRIEVERTQDSDPLLEKPSLKEDKTQEDSK